MDRSADVLVIGAGMMGLSCAYQLAKRGCSVLVLEGGSDLCSGSSGATDGYIMHHTKMPGYHMRLGLQSAALYPQLLEELGEDVEYQPNCGGFLVCEDDNEFDIVRQVIEQQRDGGLHVRMIDGYELRQLEPALSPVLRGASYAPDCGKIDPLKLCFAYARGARRYGARILVDAPVQAMVLEGERVIGVRTPKGTFYGDMVVDAAGSWAGQVAVLAGLDAPVKPRRGQVVVSEAVGPLVRGVISSAAYFALKFYPALQERFSEITRRLGHGFAVEQTQEGTLMLSYTNEFVGFDRRTTLEGLERILSVGCRFLPALREIHFIRGFSGLRPHTPDALPLVGPTALRPGFCFAAGHEGGGLALNPITGVLVAQIFCGESPIVDPAPIAPDRLVRLSTEREK